MKAALGRWDRCPAKPTFPANRPSRAKCGPPHVSIQRLGQQPSRFWNSLDGGFIGRRRFFRPLRAPEGAQSDPLSRSFAVDARPTQEVDANSCAELDPRQQLAQLITVEKKPLHSGDRSEGAVTAIPARIFELVGTI